MFINGESLPQAEIGCNKTGEAVNASPGERGLE